MGIIIAINLNILHKYVRGLIFKNVFVFGTIRIVVGAVVFVLLVLYSKLSELAGMSP